MSNQSRQHLGPFIESVRQDARRLVAAGHVRSYLKMLREIIFIFRETNCRVPALWH